MATFGWDFIKNSDSFKSMSPDEQEALARRYFTTNVADGQQGDELEKAFQAWNSANGSAEPTNTDGATPAPEEKAAPPTPEQDWGNIKAATKRNVGVVKETGKVGLQAIANVLNTPSDLANLGRIGYNAATGDDVQPFDNLVELPDDLKPESGTGKVIADVLPMLMPSKALVRGATKVASATARAAIPAGTNTIIANQAIGDTVRLAQASTDGAVKVVRAASGTSEAPDVADYLDEAKQRKQAEPERYADMPVEDIALQLRDADWAGGKAGQAVLGSTMRAGTLAVPERAGATTLENLVTKAANSTVGKGSQVGLATGGAELAKQATSSSISGDNDLNLAGISAQTGVGATLGVLGNVLGSAIKPGNQKRILKVQESTANHAEKAEALKDAEAAYGVYQHMRNAVDLTDDAVAGGMSGKATLRSRMAPVENPLAPGQPFYSVEGSAYGSVPKGVFDEVHSRYFPNLSYDEFLDLPSATVSKALKQDNAAYAGLKQAQEAMPTVSPDGLLNFANESRFQLGSPSTWVAPDLAKLATEQRKTLGLTGLAGAVSKAGSLSESGVANVARSAGEASLGKNITSEAVDRLTTTQNMFLNGGDRKTADSIGRMIDSLKEGKSLPKESLEELANINNKYNSLAAVYPHLADARINPVDVYRDARSAQQIIKGAAPTTKDASASGLIGSALLAKATGGASVLPQAALIAGKQVVDRGVLNDVRRAAGERVLGDATRTAVGDALQRNTGPAVLLGDRAMDVSQEAPVAPASQGTNAPQQEAPQIDWGNVEGYGDAKAAPQAQSAPQIDWKTVEGYPSNQVDWSNVEGMPAVEQKAQSARKGRKGEDVVADKLYAGFAAAETGNESDPWIRTRGQDASSNLHSSAYGPVQITYTLAQDYLENSPKLFTEPEKHFLRNFIKQGQLMIGTSNGYSDDPALQYGGKGYLNSAYNKRMYESVAKKMLLDTFKRNDGDLAQTISAWRGLDDPAYTEKVVQNIP